MLLGSRLDSVPDFRSLSHITEAVTPEIHLLAEGGIISAFLKQGLQGYKLGSKLQFTFFKLASRTGDFEGERKD